MNMISIKVFSISLCERYNMGAYICAICDMIYDSRDGCAEYGDLQLICVDCDVERGDDDE